MGIKHTKVSAIADGSNPTQVRPSDWNDDHTIDGDVSFNGHDITNVGNLGEFTDLSDAPATYAGSGNKLVAVNAGATGLTFIEPSAGGPVDEFTDLLDVPGSYSGQAGKVATVNAGETALEFAEASTAVDWVTPQQYGAIADGNNHALSTVYASLAEAQAAYDGAYFFVTSLTQQVDYAAIKAASNECFGADGGTTPAGDGILGGGNEGDYLQVGPTTGSIPTTDFEINAGEPNLVVDELVGYTAYVTYFSAPGFIATSLIVSNTTRVVTCATAITLAPDSMYAYTVGGEHGDNSYLNKVLYFPAGIYQLGSDIWQIRNLRSGLIKGAGRLVTELRGSGDAVLQFDGVWYTKIEDMYFSQQNSGAICAIDIDGNVPGHPYTTRGVQSCTLQNLYISGGNADYALVLCRQGGSNAQGSEMLYLNCFFLSASLACYGQYGFNALANTFMGGNFQDYTKHGAYILGGTFGFFNTGFQSTHLYQQFINEGYDIRCGDSGAFEGCPIYGCRTESPFFLYNGGSVACDVRACVGASVINGWFAGLAYNTAVSGREWVRVNSTTTGQEILMIATTAGTSGGVEPNWNVGWGSGNTVADGSVVWTECKGVGGINREFRFISGGIAHLSNGRDGGSMQCKSEDKTFPTLDGDSTLSECRPFFSDIGKCVVDTSTGPVTVPVPIASLGGNHFPGRTYTVYRGDETDDVIVDLNGLQGAYKRGLTTMFTLPRAQGSVTWISRDTSFTFDGGWIMQSSTYLRDMTADFITDLDGNELVEFAQASTDADNHVKITNADTTTSPKIEAAGSDTNVDLQLGGKGTGLVRYGTHTGSADVAISGYITIKDAAGNTRKLAVIT